MKVLVVGGGVTGLAAAHRVREVQPDAEVRLVEASGRLGGIIGTERRDGFVLEMGPDSIITDKPAGIELVRRLGLEGELIGTNSTHRRSFVVREGRLMPVPEGYQLLAPTRFDTLAESEIFSWPGKCRMLQDLVLPPRQDDADESLGDFVLRRLGREALERMAQPMIGGIYGGDPMKLSLQATLPRFHQMEREYGSVIRGMWARSGKNGREGERERGHRGDEGAGGYSALADRNLSPNTQHPTPNTQSGVSGARYGLFVSFREGMQTLTDALAARLAEGSARLNVGAEALERDGSGWRVRLSDGTVLEADRVILALPAYRSAALVRELDPELADLLEGIPYAGSATVSLCYRREEVPHPLDGFGFVVPAVEKLTLLGCTFTHVKWPNRAPEGKALLRAFLGDEALNGRDNAELERLVRADLEKLLGVTAEPEFVTTWRGARTMPHFYVGHLDRVAEIERRAGQLGIGLAGNAYRGVGIPDSIRSAETTVDAMFCSEK